MVGDQNDNSDLSTTGQRSQLSEFDRHRQTLVAQEEDQEEGWAAELRRYLKDMPANVSKETDIIEWWQVIHFSSNRYNTGSKIIYSRIMQHTFQLFRA
jgi:hypothetical protein